MSRRKVDYVYVPKKKIKKVVIDAKRGRKSIEKTVNQRQILDGAYVRASAMKEFPNGKFAKGGKMDYSKKDRVIDYYYENDVFDDYETYGLSEEDLNNENKVVKAIIEYHGLDNLENVNERFEILFGEGNDEYAKGGSTKQYRAKNFRKIEKIDYVGKDPNLKEEKWEVYVVDPKGGYAQFNVYAENQERAEVYGKYLYSKKYNVPQQELMIEVAMPYSWTKRFQIKNQYAGKTAEEIWTAMDFQQRRHFMRDHKSICGITDDEQMWDISWFSWEELKNSPIQHNVVQAFEEHIKEGQYKRGGNIGSYNTGRSWTLDHNQHNKQESYEIPMDDRTFARGGKANRNLPMTDVHSPREKNVTGSKLLFDLQYGDVFRITAPNHQKSGRLFVFVDLVESKYMGVRQIMIKAKPFPPKTNEEYVQIKDLKDGDITILSQEEAGSRLMRQQIEKQKFANGGITKNHISVGDIVLDKNDNKYYIVYEVKNDAATKRYFLPDEVAESVAAHLNPELIDWNKYTMYSDQPFVEFSVGDLVYNSAARKSGVIIRKETALDGEYVYSVKYANNAIGHYINDYELELISTYAKGGNIEKKYKGGNPYDRTPIPEKSKLVRVEMDKNFSPYEYMMKMQNQKHTWNLYGMRNGKEVQINKTPLTEKEVDKLFDDAKKSKLYSSLRILAAELANEMKRGGNIGSYNTGRSWTLDHNQHNKSENYEIPMNDRKYAKGGQIKGVEWVVNFISEVDRGDYVTKYVIAKSESEAINKGFMEISDDGEESDNYQLHSVFKLSSVKFEKGGDIPDLTNMNIDHLFANGGRTYPITEEKIYS